MAFQIRENVPSNSCGCSPEYVNAPCQHSLCAEIDSHGEIIYRHVNSPGVPPIRSGILGYDMHDNVSLGHLAPCALKVRLSSMFSLCGCTDCEENNGEYYAFPSFTNTFITNPRPQIASWVFTNCTQGKTFESCGYTHGVVTLEAAITGFAQTEYDIEMHCRLYQGYNQLTLAHHKKTTVGRVSNYGSNFSCKNFPQLSLGTAVTGNDIKCSSPTILVEPLGESHFTNPPYDLYAGNISNGATYYNGRCLEAGQTLEDTWPPHQTVSFGTPLFQSMNIGNYTRDVALHIAGSQNGGGISGIYACDECTRLDGAHMLLEDASNAPQSDASRSYRKNLDRYDFVAQTPLPYASGTSKKICCGTCDRPAASSMCINSLTFTLESGVQTVNILGQFNLFGQPTVMARYTRDMPVDMMYWNTLTGFTYKPDGITNPLRNQCNFKDLSITAVNMSPVGGNIAIHCVPKFKNVGWKGGASPDAISVTFPGGNWIKDVYKDIKVQPISVPGVCNGWTSPGGPACEYDRLDCGYPSTGGGPVGTFILTKGTFEYDGQCTTDYRCPWIVSYKYFSGNITNACEFMSIEAIIYKGTEGSALLNCRGVSGNGFYPYGDFVTAPASQNDYPNLIAVFVRWPEFHQQYSDLCLTRECGLVNRVNPVSCGFISDPYAALFPNATARRCMFFGPFTAGLLSCGNEILVDPDSFSATLNPCSATFSNGSSVFANAIAGWANLGVPIIASNA